MPLPKRKHVVKKILSSCVSSIEQAGGKLYPCFLLLLFFGCKQRKCSFCVFSPKETSHVLFTFSGHCHFRCVLLWAGIRNFGVFVILHFTLCQNLVNMASNITNKTLPSSRKYLMISVLSNSWTIGRGKSGEVQHCVVYSRNSHFSFRRNLQWNL